MSFGSRVSATVNFLAGVAMIVTCGVVLWFAFGQQPPGPEPPPKESLSLEGVHLKGDPAAKVAIVEYGDTECPACAKFETQTLPGLVARFVEPGRARFGFRHFPLPQHRRAGPAAIAAYCAGEQQKFWEMQSALFRNPSRLEDDGLIWLANELGLDENRWASCRTSEASSRTLRRDVEQARLVKVLQTPTFLIGTILPDGRLQAMKRLVGARQLDVFEAAIVEVERAARNSN
jgi:protein-disulfide isomerase